MSNIDFAYMAINIFPKALIIVDKDGQIIISNKAFLQLVKKEAVEGINCRNLISNIATVNFNETKTGCLLDINNRTMNADYFSLKKDGSLIGGIFIFKGMLELNEAESRFKDRFQKGRSL
jgi:transcriptional regulator with PAS, ATPase and Fis domain